ncbi:MAG: energy transducer TonB [Bacteroidia bacterium]|nr:energy transducer TonB [Bacteroidia bacterium]
MQQNQAYYIQNQSNNHNWAGLAGTIFIHGAIFLALYFFILVPPNPPWADGGGPAMILGQENMGGESTSPVQDPQPNETYTPLESQPTPDELSQSTDDDVDVVAKVNDKKTDAKKPVVTPPTEKPKDIVELPKTNPNALFKRKNGANNTAGGYGSGTEPGNEGRPDGTPDGVLGGTGNGGLGSGGDGPGGDGTAGGGIKYSLGGRRVAKKPVISTNSNDVGIVVVNITVDRQGNVIKAEPGARGTTTLNLDKLKVAKQAALDTKFSPKPDGPTEQFGTMTVSFAFD